MRRMASRVIHLDASVAPPPDWDDALYLERNPDVRAAVTGGVFPSGYVHYAHFGIKENRESGFRTEPEVAAPLTRNCLDPWLNLEVAANGDVRPCCISPAVAGQAVDTVDRGSDAFRELRSELLSGNLREMCRRCHIRSSVPVHEFARRVEFLADAAGVQQLDALPLKSLRVDVNEECNLRCTYCAVSQPGYAGKRMEAQVLDAVLDMIGESPHVRVDLNGHGETSFHPKWVDFVERIHALEVEATILSNFAKIFSPAEVDAFARMGVIQISIDSVDEHLLRNIRRKVSLATIRLNIRNIRSRASALGLSPRWSISCGVYDLNLASLPGLARFAIDERFEMVTFWNLIEYPVIEGALMPKPLSSLPEVRRAEALRQVSMVVATLREAGITVEIPEELT